MQAIVADDDELSLDLLSHVLRQMGHRVELARNGREVMKLLASGSTQLVITDWQMPELNGLELCKAIRAADCNGYVYIIMLTAQDTPENKIEGLHAGADAFLTKPLNPAELQVCLRTADRILSLETRDLAMFALAKLAESRDPDTGEHIERVQSYSRLLAQQLSRLPQYQDVVDAEFVRLIYQTSALHDIGKVGIPDGVLLKPDKLDPGELVIMKTHAELGAQTLDAALQRFPTAKFLRMARDIAMSHHEKYDGSGYPKGLAGDQIPLSARIVALADVYDALTSRRVYKYAMSHAQARAVVTEERGRHFDPDVVDAFLVNARQFIAVAQHLKDPDDGSATPLPARQPVPPTTAAPETILIVEDEPAQLEVLKAMVEAEGYRVVTAGDGEQALRVLAEHRPRIIISDWAMPVMDGLSLCRQVRAMRDWQYVYIVMLTIHAEKHHLVEAFDAGVDDFVAKPVEEVELAARLRSGLRAVTLHDDMKRQNQGSTALNAHLSGLNSRLEKLAITDDLTGLYNRRHAMLRLEEHWSRADRYTHPLSVMTVDIDHFKQINDSYGHAAGDAILRQVAEILRHTARVTDSVCRTGGEEFLIICPAETTCEAVVFAERCRQAVAGHPFKIEGHAIRVTISIGVSSKRPDLPHYTEMLGEADRALYHAKREGRDRVVVSPQCAGKYLTPPVPQPPCPVLG